MPSSNTYEKKCQNCTVFIKKMSNGKSRTYVYMFYIFRQINFNFYYRRVHITKATLLELGDKFEVEDGKGSERDDILAKLNLETFLIIPPKQQVRKIDIV